MTKLTDLRPRFIRRFADYNIFYLQADPNCLHNLPADAEFTMVYSPQEDEGWQAVQYQVIDVGRGYTVLERRALETDEIRYFEQLLHSE